MIQLVISGGQTGADQAAWRAAKACGIRTSGRMPRGFLTEDGLHPEFAAMFGAREHASPLYPQRTRANVAESEATLWFGNQDTRGGRLTLGCCHAEDKPIFVVDMGRDCDLPDVCAAWIAGDHPPGWGTPIAILNVAGNRESKSPGIGLWVERYLIEVFRHLGFPPDLGATR